MQKTREKEDNTYVYDISEVREEIIEIKTKQERIYKRKVHTLLGVLSRYH
jgi:hypothetical protein